MLMLIPITAESKAEDGMCFLLPLLLGEHLRTESPSRASRLISLHYAKKDLLPAVPDVCVCVFMSVKVCTRECAYVW